MRRVVWFLVVGVVMYAVDQATQVLTRALDAIDAAVRLP